MIGKKQRKSTPSLQRTEKAGRKVRGSDLLWLQAWLRAGNGDRRQLSQAGTQPATDSAEVQAPVTTSLLGSMRQAC